MDLYDSYRLEEENTIRRLESLKLFLQKNYTKIMLLGVLIGGSGVAISKIHNPHRILPKKNNEITLTQENPIIKDKLHTFAKFLNKQALGKIQRGSTLGRYLRVSRFRDHIQEAADTYNIPFDYLFALIMVESQGNTASINPSDGGAGFIHFQPDVAKEYGLKIFTDNEKYKKYDLDTLIKYGEKKKDIYTIHGTVLQDIIDNKGMAALEQLDERFHTLKCIDATARYLQKIKKYVDEHQDEACKDHSRDIYTRDPSFDLGWMLAINGFNKGYRYDKNKDKYRFTIGFEDGTHIKNIKHNLTKMRKYEQYVQDMMRYGKSSHYTQPIATKGKDSSSTKKNIPETKDINQKIYNGLQTTKFI